MNSEAATKERATEVVALKDLAASPTTSSASPVCWAGGRGPRGQPVGDDAPDAGLVLDFSHLLPRCRSDILYLLIFELFADALFELPRFYWLDQIVDNFVIHGLSYDTRSGFHRQHDHRYGGQIRIGAQFPERVQATQLGHDYVEYDQVGSSLPGQP